MGREKWRGDGVALGTVFRLRPSDLDRVGHCWMNGRLREGDLAMPVEHSGDCFFYYELLEGGFTLHDGDREGPGYRWCRGGRFGAYSCGVPFEEQPTREERFLLFAGKSTFFSDRLDVEGELGRLRDGQAMEMAGIIERAVSRVRDGHRG